MAQNNEDQLQQQYQDILNKYASSMSPPPTETILEVSPAPEQLMPDPTVITSDAISEETNPLNNEFVLPVQDNNTQPIADKPDVNFPADSIEASAPNMELGQPVTPSVESMFSYPTIPQQAFVSPITDKPVPPIYFPPEPVLQNTSNFFKYLFFFSLLVFIAVASAVVYNLLNSQVVNTTTSVVPTTTPAPSVVAVPNVCEVGDDTYNIGQTFPAASSCNTCTCTSNLTVACTENVCTSPSSVPVTTIVKPTTKPISGKVYKDIKYGYQFQCPSSAKYVLEATSVNGNKIPYKQESCTLDDSIVTISVYDNTVVHSFGNLQTQVSPDKKYVFTFEGSDDTIIASFKFL